MPSRCLDRLAGIRPELSRPALAVSLPVVSSSGVLFIPGRVRILLAELELLSHGSTQSWNATGGGESEGGTGHPPGDQHPPHLELRKLYLKQSTDEGRASVEKTMRATLKEYRGTAVDRSCVVGETREQENDRILRTGEGFTADEVARRFNCTPTRVRRLRLAKGRDTLGHKPGGSFVSPTSDEECEREARRMKSQLGMSVRAIALALHRPSSTVGDWVKAA
jgi:hypothetical protein